MRNRRRNLELLARRVPKGLSSDGEVLKVARLLWETIDTPVSLKLALLCEAGQLEDALRVEFDPSRYLDWDWKTAGDDYQAIAFIRKMPLSISGVDRASTAWKKFQDAEEQCRKTNLRFRTARVRGFPPRVDAVLFTACRKISAWLGDLSAKSWALRCRFGPGVDALNTGERVSAYYKLSRPSVTADFYEGALALVQSHPVWVRALQELDPERYPVQLLDEDESGNINHLPEPPIDGKIGRVPGNRVAFVPKTALVDRSIAIEPGMNIFAQLGLGALIRGRLKRIGLDLDDQLPNQLLARKGSSLGSVATIDLSSASDTLATELVRELLPDKWFTALDWCRSKKGTYHPFGQEPTTFWYEKFSSMGNGYTFELESMVFYALALSCCEVLRLPLDDVRSYGDDITVPSEAVTLLGEVLTFCGFTVNTSKSYSTGVFRESCGADFFNGKNIRPYFLKEYCNDARSLFRLANGIRRVAYRRNLGFGCDSKLRSVYTHVVSRIPDSLRELRVPFRDRLTPWPDVESGDGGLAVNHDEALSSRYVRFCRAYQTGWLFAELQATALTSRADRWPELYAYALYRSRNGDSSETTSYDQVVGRGESRVRLNEGAYAPSWFNLGPWA